MSYGPANRGYLINPARVPRRGHGLVSPPRWHKRGLRYGTDELVAVIRHAGQRMVASDRRAVIGVADLSPKHGGPSAWHRSHQTGRDVDLLFFVTDERRKPLSLNTMVHFRADGTGLLTTEDSGEGASDEPQTIYFDTERNWRLVRTLIENPIAKVQYIFVADWLKQRLLDHAHERGEPNDLVLAASHLMREPSVSPHDDHFHIRVYCADNDRSMGCVDYGRLRWNKKDFKYGATPRAQALQAAAITAVSLTPLPVPVVLLPGHGLSSAPTD